MTITETTVAQLILDAEQAEGVVRGLLGWPLGTIGVIFPFTFDVEPQPERVTDRKDMAWRWKSLPYRNKELLHAAIVWSWWHANGNTGSPRVGQRVGLVTKIHHSPMINDCRIVHATATLATVPRVEQLKELTYHDWDNPDAPAVDYGRFIVIVKVTP